MVTMHRKPLPVLALLALAPSIALAQAPQKPTPGPEHKRLGYFVGRWKGEAEVKQNPFLPAGKHTSSDDCEWFEGRFAVVCRNEAKTPMGPMKGLGLMTYSPEEKAYLYYGIDSSGMAMAAVSKGTVNGDTWVYMDESKLGDKMVKQRFTIRELSPTSYSFTWEMQGEDGSWMALLEGKQTKAR
jgi:hypothetical protein